MSATNWWKCQSLIWPYISIVMTSLRWWDCRLSWEKIRHVTHSHNPLNRSTGITLYLSNSNRVVFYLIRKVFLFYCILYSIDWRWTVKNNMFIFYCIHLSCRLSSRSGRSRSGERSFGGSCCGSSYVSSEESCDSPNTKYRVVMLGEFWFLLDLYTHTVDIAYFMNKCNE